MSRQRVAAPTRHRHWRSGCAPGTAPGLSGWFRSGLSLQCDQADGLRGGVHAQHDGRQRARRQAAQVGHGQVGDVTERRVGIGAGLEVDFDEAHAGQRARLAVVDVCAQREEALEGVVMSASICSGGMPL